MQALTAKNPAEDARESHPLQFLLNDVLVSIDNINPTHSVLNYLREDQQLTGTKEGCAEGDCGACTIVLAELDSQIEPAQLVMKTVNACIQFVPTLAGKALYTVEYLRQQQPGELHPVQRAMVEQHGSQCGFCTPGFIMSLWCLYNQHAQQQDAATESACPDFTDFTDFPTRPTRSEVRSALTGNLCRCTGYKPILQAADAMFDAPLVRFDQAAVRARLQALQAVASSVYTHATGSFYTPRTLNDLLKLKAEHPEATLLAGGTDVGLWVNKQFRTLNPLIYLGEVNALKTIEKDTQYLSIGAGVTLTNAYQALRVEYPEMNEIWERFASRPIRNMGTLGGNIANGSPIGDSMPALMVLGTRVVLHSLRGQRELALADLYLDYMKKDLAADEVLTLIKIPLPDVQAGSEANPAQQFRCYKLSKRYDSDISAVFAGFALTLAGDTGDTVESVKIAFGGMAATPKRALQCEQVLQGQPWDEATVRQAMQALKKDYAPLSDMRASDTYRLQTAQNLLYRFYLETRLQNPLSPAALNVFHVAATD